MKLFICFALLGLLSLSVVHCQGCTNCSPNDRCCVQGVIGSTFATCYNPLTSQCDFCSRRSAKLCGLQDRCCGDTCYDITSHVCVGSPTGAALCPINTLRCGDACYDPTKFSCTNNNNLIPNPSNQVTCNGSPCPSGQQCCGSTCYSTTNNFCCVGNSNIRFDEARPIVCPKGSGCCVVFNGSSSSNICYDTKTEYCDLMGDRVCQLGSRTNCRTA